jgi:hypothetical protein
LTVTDKYIAEVCFGDRFNLRAATAVYNAKANKFQSGLSGLQAKYEAWLSAHKLALGVETVDNFDSCTIKLKSLPEDLAEDLKSEVVALFNTIWSQ